MPMRHLELLFVAALVLYSTAIWADRITGRLRPWMIAVFGAGLAADATGTLALCVPAADAWRWTVHSVSGLAALAIMALHFAWAVQAARMPGTHAALFRRWSLAAWSLWLVAFFSGALLR